MIAKYSALISQSGESDPVAVVFENTIGDIIWNRLSKGVYEGFLAGAFLENKTAFGPPRIDFQNATCVEITRGDNDRVSITTNDFVNFPVLAPCDSGLQSVFIEIKTLS